MFQEILIEIITVVILVLGYAIAINWSADKIDEEIENK
tara:strand:+ start:606 stop:719 length:114 start_codon:yes stop_codon:yes gene_type:complete